MDKHLMQIDIADGPGLKCARCDALAINYAHVFQGKPYCSSNCALQVSAGDLAKQLAGAVQEGRGGALMVMQDAQDLVSILSDLQPCSFVGMDGKKIDPGHHPLCPFCWRTTEHRATEPDDTGASTLVHSCRYCDWWDGDDEPSVAANG